MPSTAIKDHDYDAALRQLAITFVTGRIYVYFDVPLEVADSLEHASSKGAYFNRHIRDRYDFREITPAEFK
ncbi:MAG TPA: KTSC domain-containing protein [Pseudolabrys sp.]|nr:KTSC domain-containing protein [Pseudolabrys sp.]